MLFGQSVVEKQQANPVIDRRGTVVGHEAATKLLPNAPPARFQHSHSGSRLRGPPHQRQHLGMRQFARGDIELPLGAIQSERTVSRVDRQILQQYGLPLGNPGIDRTPEKRPLARHQRRPHEDLAHEGIDERRMDPVTAEMAHPQQAATNRSPTLSEPMSREIHGYCFSMPASRPVEKAICRL